MMRTKIAKLKKLFYDELGLFVLYYMKVTVYE